MTYNLKTKYMGFELRNPIVVSSSGLTNNVENIKKIEDAGAGAVVLKSLFEEQIIDEIDAKLNDNDMYFWFPEAREHVKSISTDHGVNQYLQLIKEVKKEVSIPVIASINCMTATAWPAFASKIEEAGADGLELNISIMPRNDEVDCRTLELEYIQTVEEVRRHTKLPISVKLAPYFTHLAQICKGFTESGATNIVLFNRYLKPDVDIDSISITRNKYHSNEDEIAESLRWIALLSNRNYCELTASTGIHTGADVIKAILVGATAVQIATTLYTNGLDYIRTMISDMESWMREKAFNSIDTFKGKLSEGKQATAAFERVQFMKKTTDA
jgi:dihydroorotate dehydrogenase (fumarate)